MNSHADVILSRILEAEAWGHSRPFNLKLASVYADHFPENDFCRPLCKKHGVPVFPTVKDAVGVGSHEVSVEGVILIGEHGPYASNGRRLEALSETPAFRRNRPCLPHPRGARPRLLRQVACI